ncbi:MAG TPA: hypothetical protein VL136_04170 [Candidatus Babeliales bacterium]|nr:hypothetical protein [Candidatus Babeliales bacterium]
MHSLHRSRRFFFLHFADYDVTLGISDTPAMEDEQKSICATGWTAGGMQLFLQVIGAKFFGAA